MQAPPPRPPFFVGEVDVEEILPGTNGPVDGAVLSGAAVCRASPENDKCLTIANRTTRTHPGRRTDNAATNPPPGRSLRRPGQSSMSAYFRTISNIALSKGPNHLRPGPARNTAQSPPTSPRFFLNHLCALSRGLLAIGANILLLVRQAGLQRLAPGD